MYIYVILQIERLQKENEYLRSQKMKLKKQLEDKEAIVTDLMTLNINLQKKVISEYTEISKINKEIETKVLSNVDELLRKFDFSSIFINI